MPVELAPPAVPAELAPAPVVVATDAASMPSAPTLAPAPAVVPPSTGDASANWRSRLGLGAAAAVGGAALATAANAARSGADTVTDAAAATASATRDGISTVTETVVDKVSDTVSAILPSPAPEATAIDIPQDLAAASAKVDDSVRSIEDELRSLVEPLPEPVPAVEPDAVSAAALEAVSAEAPAGEPSPTDFSLSIEEELERALSGGLGDARPIPAIADSQALTMPILTAPTLEATPVEPPPVPAPDVVASLPEPSVNLDALAAELLGDPAPVAPPVADPSFTLAAQPVVIEPIIERLPEAVVAPAVPDLAAVPSPPTAPLLREGVIAGIPFRLYGDGSIEADINGEVSRFASLKAFRTAVGG
jgi:hypothetical protein